MPIVTRLRNDTALFTVTGTLSADDAIEAIGDFYSGRSAKHALWDFTGASLSGLMASEFRRIAQYGSQFVSQRGDGARTAFVVKDDVQGFLIRAYSAHASSINPIQLKTFDDAQEAWEWLESNREED